VEPYLIIFFAQILCSLVRTLSVNALVRSDIYQAVGITAISDFVLLSSWAFIMKTALAGGWGGILIAVLGSSVGNTIAMLYKLKRKRHDI